VSPKFTEERRGRREVSCLKDKLNKSADAEGDTPEVSGRHCSAEKMDNFFSVSGGMKINHDKSWLKINNDNEGCPEFFFPTPMP